MITIIFTYRNRDISIVKKSIDTLQNQTSKAFKVVLVNYGSNASNTDLINNLITKYAFISIINCKTSKALWCKSRAVNIVLKQIETPYCFVADVDMLFHPTFIEKLEAFKKENTVTYFQVGFLTQEESLLNKSFEDYNINFKSNEEATGMTLFNTSDLLSINGFDEFYNGWGSEDTDVHIRLENKGVIVNFYNNKLYMLHQWHPKHYRTKNSLEPYHSYQEQVNNSYLKFTKDSKKTKANLKFAFGEYKESNYQSLKQPTVSYTITNKRAEIKGFIQNVLLQESDVVLQLTVIAGEEFKSLKQKLKKVFGKKTIAFLDMQTVNDLLLETIIYHLRNCPYKFKFNTEKEQIELIIKL